MLGYDRSIFIQWPKKHGRNIVDRKITESIHRYLSDEFITESHANVGLTLAIDYDEGEGFNIIFHTFLHQQMD